MTQIKEGLAKQPSPELLSLIKAAAQSLLGFGELWGTIKKKGADEGFAELDLQDMLRPLLRDRLGMNKDKIYYLFHKEEVKERNSERYKEMSDAYRKKTTFDVDKVIEQTPIPEEQIRNSSDRIVAKNLGIEKELGLDKTDEEEEPSELDLLKIKNAQLEDALHKTQQFTQATKLQPQEIDIVNTVVVRAGLEKIEAAVHNEISSMRNRGWKTVEITMRAV
jgi:hypothetical protein